MAADKYEYFLKWWGGCEEAAKKEFGYPGEMYFDTMDERQAVWDNISKHRHLGLAQSMSEGHMTHTRPVVTLVFQHEGKQYTVVDDSFGAEYEDHLAEYWWEEGNGACDCNRLAYINAVDPTVPTQEHCSNNVELVSLDIHRVPYDSPEVENAVR